MKNSIPLSVKVVYTTKYAHRQLQKINEYLLLLLFSKSHPFALLPSFLHPKTRRNVTNLTKRKKKRSIKNNTYKLFTRTKFYFLKIQLPFGRTCPWVQCNTSIYIRKVALQSANNWVRRMGKIALPRRIAYFLNEQFDSQLLRLHADISVTAEPKVCTPSSKYFVVKRSKPKT